MDDEDVLQLGLADSKVSGTALWLLWLWAPCAPSTPRPAGAPAPSHAPALPAGLHGAPAAVQHADADAAVSTGGWHRLGTRRERDRVGGRWPGRAGPAVHRVLAGPQQPADRRAAAVAGGLGRRSRGRRGAPAAQPAAGARPGQPGGAGAMARRAGEAPGGTTLLPNLAPGRRPANHAARLAVRPHRPRRPAARRPRRRR